MWLPLLPITFGTALNLSLDYLINHGYTVDGYGNNVVYLRDINQFNYYWPDATLYYGNGGLARSEFLYSTSYPDMMRYNSLYNSFTGTYGSPVNIVMSLLLIKMPLCPLVRWRGINLCCYLPVTYNRLPLLCILGW